LSGTGAAAYRLSRSSAALVIVPQDVAFSPGSVVNAASFSPGIAPGGLFTIFGDGLAGPGAATEVRIDGTTATVVAQTPFQINAQVPLDLAPGVYRLLVKSPYGQAEQPLEIRETAPALFLLAGSWSGQGRAAIVNQDGRLNSPLHSARRGQTVVAYCTGLGGVVSRGGLWWARNLAVGVLDGKVVPVAYAGLTPGFIGLYQVNVPIPAAASPGLELPFQLRQGQSESNVVWLSVE
jgi:uncharacterized protein (TIGR03437 family)